MEREVVHAEPNLRPVLVSYAHAGKESDRAAERFNERLVDLLKGLVPLDPDTDMGFFDTKGLPGGVLWESELATVLGYCQVLVALLSPLYLESEWCGKEWHAFTPGMRESKPRKKVTTVVHQGSIVPVRWAPIPFDLPPLITEAQIFRPERTQAVKELPGQPAYPHLPEEYDEDGLFGLLCRGQEGAFNSAVWDLAKRIQKIYYSRFLLPREFTPSELKNAFDGVVLCHRTPWIA